MFVTRAALARRMLVGAIDQGTSSSRFIVFDNHGTVIESHGEEFPQVMPREGWVEHDPMVILNSVKSCINRTAEKLLRRGIDPREVKAIGVTNQRETLTVWDSVTGMPLHNAIVWLDTRTTETVSKMAARLPDNNRGHFVDRCGLPLATYFSAVKYRWLLDNGGDAIHDAIAAGTMRIGTIDTWLIYNLTGGAPNDGVFVTDVTNASRTMLMNLHTLSWDDELCNFFGVDKNFLPAIKSSAEVYGTVADGPLMGAKISGCAGDQQAALVGHRCLNEGDVKNTYGTGCFMLYNTGSQPVISTHGLLSTVAYQLGKDAPATYALEGSVAIAGAAIKWLRDSLQLANTAPAISALAAQVPDTAGVYFVPAFSGLFAPRWRDDARGVIVGLTQFANKKHLCRAALEAVCFQTREVLESMQKDAGGRAFGAMNVDGGMTSSDLLVQMQADLLDLPITRPVMQETTALGAAFLAGVGAGLWGAESDQMTCNIKSTTFNPTSTQEDREKRFRGWNRAVERALNLAGEP